MDCESGAFGFFMRISEDDSTATTLWIGMCRDDGEDEDERNNEENLEDDDDDDDVTHLTIAPVTDCDPRGHNIMEDEERNNHILDTRVCLQSVMMKMMEMGMKMMIRQCRMSSV